MARVQPTVHIGIYWKELEGCKGKNVDVQVQRLLDQSQPAINSMQAYHNWQPAGIAQLTLQMFAAPIPTPNFNRKP